MKEKIVHLITPFLFHTGSWIYSQIKGINAFENYVFTRNRENIIQFPYDKVISFSEFNIIKRAADKIYRKLFGPHYGLFFNNYLKKISPKLIHAHFGFEAFSWLKFVKKNNLPLITTFYGLDVSKLGRIVEWRNNYKYLFDYGKFFLVEGNFMKKQLMELGCYSEKIIVQHLGVDIDSYPVKNYNDDNKKEIVILQVSTFREKKGLKYSLQAVAKLKNNYSNFIFKIIGKGDNHSADEEINELIKSLNIQDKVQLLGTKTHNEMLQELTQADIFLHPSITASDGDNEGGAPVGIIEASAVGMPVVSTLHADIPEVVLNNESGFLVPEKDPDFLSDKLSTIIDQRFLIKKFGTTGREHVRANYNLKTQIKKLEQIYHRV